MEEALFNAYLYFLVVITGACVGSFINVAALRLPKGVSFMAGRSQCPGCGETLKWQDLIPLLSYIYLKGRCRYCNRTISPRYPIVETVSAVLAALCFARFGLSLRTVLSFGVSAILLAITLIDLDTMEIPDSLNIALVPLALLAIFVFDDVSLFERVCGFFAISLPMLLLTLAIPGAFGGGDIKLIAVCGFLLGWKCVLVAFFISLLTGGGYAIYLLACGKGRRGEHMAFGPYLCAGVFAAMLWGPEMLRLYMNFYM